MNKLDRFNFNFSKLKTPITVYETKTVVEGGIPRPPEEVKIFEGFAHIEEASIRDFKSLELDMAESTKTVFLRNIPDGFRKSQKIKVHGDSDSYTIEEIMEDYRNSGFTVLNIVRVENDG